MLNNNTEVVQDAPATLGSHPPSTPLDADICNHTITSDLNGAAKAASPVPCKKNV